MKQETLKKVIELADGFICEKVYSPDNRELCRIKFTNEIGIWCMSGVVENWSYYPLILRRAVNGINEIGEYEISLRIGYILLEIDDPKVEDLKDWDYDDYPKTEYLTPQEQAIEACLIELLEESEHD